MPCRSLAGDRQGVGDGGQRQDGGGRLLVTHQLG